MMNTSHYYPQTKPASIPSVIFNPGNTISIRKIREGRGEELHHLSRFYTIFWVIRGEAFGRVDRQEIIVQKGQIICIGPKSIYRLDTEGCLEGYLIRFADAYLPPEEQESLSLYTEGLSHLFSGMSILTIREEMEGEMKSISEGMVREYENIFLYKDQLLKKYIKIFLIYLSRHTTREESELYSYGNTRLVQKFLALVEREFRSVKSVQEYARRLSVTPNHLNVVVKQNTLFPAGYHIRQRIIVEARRLAIHSDLCMKEIAYSLGFSDTAHFSKFFKKSAGVNWSQFKRGSIHLVSAIFIRDNR